MTVKLPEGLKWGIQESTIGGYLLKIIPAEGYTWDFPLCNPNGPTDHPYFAVHLKNPRDKEQTANAQERLLEDAYASSRVLKPKVRRVP